MAISQDLRERIIKMVEGSSTEVAEHFDVSASFVRKLRIQHAQTGCIEARTAPGRERLVQRQSESSLRQCLAEKPDATLNELRETFGERTGIQVSETTMWRTLRRMGYTVKKSRSAQPNKTDRM